MMFLKIIAIMFIVGVGGRNTNFYVTVTPNLRDNTVVLSLPTVYDVVFPHLSPQKRTTTYITSVIYLNYNSQNEYSIKDEKKFNKSNGKNSMDCDAVNKLNETYFGLFCLNKGKWSIETRNYNPTNVTQAIELHMELEGVSDNGKVYKEAYVIMIEIKEQCQAESTIYGRLKECMEHEMKEMNQTRKQNEMVNAFEVEEKDKKTVILISNFTFFFPQDVSIPKEVSIYNHNLSLLESKQITGYSVKFDFTDVNDSQFYIVKWFNSKGNVIKIPAGMKMYYYSLTSLCQDKSCLFYFYNLQFVLKLSGETTCQHSETPAVVNQTYNKCRQYSDFDSIQITSPTKHVVVGKSIQIKCNSGRILLPHKFYVEESNHKGEYDIVEYSSVYQLNATTYGDYAYYICRMTTFDDRKSYSSKKLLIEFTDVFTAKLQFELPKVKYTLKFLIDRELQNKTKDAQRKNISTIIEKTFNSSNLKPYYYVAKFSNSTNGKVEVIGSLSIKKTTLKTKNMSYQQWVTLLTEAINNQQELETVNLLVYTFYTCPKKRIRSTRNDYYYYDWGILNINQTGYQQCPDGRANVTVECLPYSIDGYGHLENFNDSQCEYTMTQYLEDLWKSNITSENAVEMSKLLKKISHQASSYNTYDVMLSVEAADKLLAFADERKNVIDNMFTIVDNLLDTSPSVLTTSETANSTSFRLRNILGMMGEIISSTNKSQNISKRNFGLACVTMQKKDALNISILATTENDHNTLEIVNGVVEFNNESNVVLTLPQSMFSHIQNDSDKGFNIVSIVYRSDKLFSSNGTQRESFRDIKSYILSVEIRNKTIKDLKEPIRMNFRTQNVGKTYDKSSLKCVYWDVNRTGWIEDGISMHWSDENEERVTCSSNHLTNFAILFNAKPPEDNHGEILTIVTYIGLSLSLAGSLLTLLTYIIFPMLRETTPPKILMNLCVSIICMNVVFLTGVERRIKSTAACQAIAFLLQYFFLTIFAWSGVEGFHSARGLVFPMKVEISNFLPKACLISWGAPLVITGVGFGIWHYDYGNEQSCVVGDNPFIVTLLVPVAIMMLLNVMALVGISCALQSKNKYTSNSLTPKERMRIIGAFIVLFGITWVFGFFTINNNIVVFQYFFCVFSGLQGLYILLLYGVRNKKVRIYWSAILRGKSIAQLRRTSTRRIAAQIQKTDGNSNSTFKPSVSDTETYSM